MKKKINCFIPFGNPKDTIQTVKELQASELVNKIYLLSADTNKECLPGCECLLINGLYSTSTIKTICFLPSSFTVCLAMDMDAPPRSITLPKIAASENTRNQFPAKLVKLGAKFSVIVVQISIWLVKIMIKEEAIATPPICHPLNVNATSTTSATTIPMTPNIFSPF